MTDKAKQTWVYVLSAIFIALNIIFIVNDFYWFALIPVALIIILLFFFALDRLLLIITFLTPLAINIRNFDQNISMSLPNEPLMFGILCLFLIKVLFDRSFIVPKLFKHPVSIAIMINLFWILVTSFTSEIPIVSLKFLLSRLWFVVPFYFFAVLMFKRIGFIKAFVWAYGIPLAIVIVYSTANLISWGFDENAVHWVMSPFYNDHTAYGAAISFFVPVLTGFLFLKKINNIEKTLIFILLILIIIGLVLSYSRAAWISVACALIVALIFIFRISYKWIIVGIIALGALVYVTGDQLMWKMEKNKQDSSAKLSEHVRSISNITSDASNLERINRWNSALRMFKERPFFGWGPGTYQFLYAPFQNSKEKTIISTNAGDRGNAHSEYIGPLTESGVIGLLTVLGIIVTVIITGFKNYRKLADRDMRIVSLIFILGLITYFIHGTLNNFLDTDKASVPFWAFIAVIVSLDIFYPKVGNVDPNEK